MAKSRKPSSKAKLADLRKLMREGLVQGLERVTHVEPTIQSVEHLSAWVEQQSGGGRVISTRVPVEPAPASEGTDDLFAPRRAAIARWVAENSPDDMPRDLHLEGAVLAWLDADQSRWDRAGAAYRARFAKPARPRREPVDVELQALMKRDVRLPEARQRMADARSERQPRISDERLLRARQSIEDAERPQSERELSRLLGELFGAPHETMRERLKRLRKPRPRPRPKG